MTIYADKVKTHIEVIDVETEADSYSDDGTENTQFRELERQYNTKEDADVAVFLKIVEQMPLKSLLHLLQGHVRSSNQEQYTKTYTELRKSLSISPSKSLTKKKFRWADSSDKSVILEVHEVDPLKEEKQLWFDDAELMDIRRGLIRQIRFLMKHHRERLEILDHIVAGQQPEPVIEQHMKNLTKHSIGRGLEGHMSKLVPQHRAKHSKGIIAAQTACRNMANTYDQTCEILREQALQNSETLKTFAKRMAKCDEIEALTANLSHWEGQP